MLDGTCSVPECSSKPTDRAMCKKHYTRWYRHGDPNLTLLATTMGERLERYVARDAVSGCWNWTGSRNNMGYGTLAVGGHKKGKAHRASYEHFVGPIPAGLTLDHLCRNRLCVNPEHLEPVTHEENVRRGARGVLKTHCKHGHEFTPDNIYWTGPGRSHRRCRACTRAQQQEARRIASA